MRTAEPGSVLFLAERGAAFPEAAGGGTGLLYAVSI